MRAGKGEYEMSQPNGIVKPGHVDREQQVGRPKDSRRVTPPDPEVTEKPVRRKFTAKYKRQILRQAENCKPGNLVLCRAKKGCTFPTWQRGENRRKRLNNRPYPPKSVVANLWSRTRFQNGWRVRAGERVFDGAVAAGGVDY